MEAPATESQKIKALESARTQTQLYLRDHGYGQLFEAAHIWENYSGQITGVDPTAVRTVSQRMTSDANFQALYGSSVAEAHTKASEEHR